MISDRRDKTNGLLAAMASSLVAVGLVLVAASFAWPWLDDGASGWQDSQAAEYQQVSAELHRRAYQAQPRTASDAASADPELDQLQQRSDQLLAQLEQARNRPQRIAQWIRWSGIALALVGAVGYAIMRPPD